MDENKDKAEDIMRVASGIDWSKGDVALLELKDSLYDLGIYINQDSEEWKILNSTM
jgi:hypothetical protein